MKTFFRACDTDFDDRLSLDELLAYAEKHRLPLKFEIVAEMFNDIVRGRAVINEKHRNDPLTLDEVMAAVRGRHKWNSDKKEWEVSYKPARDYWIIML